MLDKSKIAIFDNSVRTTGAFKSSLILAEMAKENAEVVFLLPQKSELDAQLKSEGYHVIKIPVVELRKKWTNLVLYLPCLLFNSIYLRWILRRLDIRLLIMNDYHNLLGAGVKILGWRGVLVTYVRRLPSSYPSVLNKIWTALAFASSRTVVAVSNAVYKQLPTSPKKFRIYNVLDVQEKHANSLPQSTQGFTFLYLGNYMEGKGQRLALEAFAKVARQYPAARLRFFGDDMGVEANQKFKSSLAEFAEQAGIDQQIELNEYTKDIELAIKNADVLLNFSYAESFSRTCLEAGYYGRAVIASRCGGPEEIIVHGVTGLLVGNKAVDEMVAAMCFVLENQEHTTQMGAQAREHIRSVFSLVSVKPLVHKHVLCDE